VERAKTDDDLGNDWVIPNRISATSDGHHIAKPAAGYSVTDPYGWYFHLNISVFQHTVQTSFLLPQPMSSTLI
jgi:hypothetical protein